MTAAVEIDDLTVEYGGTLALTGVDLALRPGTLTAVIGPNGSGKSTLLSAIAGLVEPTRGRVRVLGAPPPERHDRIAYVMQATTANPSVPLTVRETVRMGRYARAGAFRRLTRADRTAIDEAIGRMGIAELVGRQLHELSGGQRQRTYVAQGLAQQAEVLLLDEPTTGLDLVTQETVADVVREERDAGTCVVLTTHDVGTARAGDHVVLVATRLVAEGAADRVLTPGNLARAYGGHVHLLGDGTVVLDDPHHHGAPGQHPE